MSYWAGTYIIAMLHLLDLELNIIMTLGQTVEKPQELSGKICLREVPSESVIS